MFVSPKLFGDKKTFQKPNILRRKSKVVNVKPNVQSPTLSSVVKDTSERHSDQLESVAENNVRHDEESTTKVQIVFESIETETDANINTTCELPVNNRFLEQNTLNIESFINDEETEQGIPLSYIETPESFAHITSQDKTKWPVFEVNPIDIMGTNLSPKVEPHNQLQQGISNGTTLVNIKPVIKFKCEVPNCNKDFWMKERLSTHLKSHSRNSTVRNTAEIVLECPVKKIADDGTEEKCPHTFQVRGDLLKHLNSDHSPEDAPHRCGGCGRRFFWSAGVRAHVAAGCSRGAALVCTWAGCARVFRLPCRLREHQRSHTGDRPYVCNYPECGWAFRSASKLGRHARRHTGERRHVCVACGRAFLRREHLRDHAARLHHHKRHACNHPGCKQTFTNINTMHVHMKRVHKDNKKDVMVMTKVEEPDTLITVEEDESLVDGGGACCAAGEGAEGAEVAEGAASEEGAARTHCAWPLPRRAHSAPAHAHRSVAAHLTHIDPVEDSSSNVYTVRSDLFLHGNVPIEEDSQHIGGGDIAEDSEECAALDNDLGLIDSHPTIDLMQEELMYDDAAVDESTFRVFLINGEELA